MNTLELMQEQAGDGQTFLPSIEKPEGLMMKLAFELTDFWE